MIINLFREKNSNVLLGTYFLKCVILPIRLCIPANTTINPAPTKKRNRNC